MSQGPTPIVLLGRTAAIGNIVSENLKPEFEVIHFIADDKVAKEDLPLLLSGKQPRHSSEGGVGSQNYSKPAEAILLGLGFTNEIVSDFRDVCQNTENKVPWFTGGYSREAFAEMIKTNPPPPPETYGPISAKKAKQAMQKVFDDGQSGQDGVYTW